MTTALLFSGQGAQCVGMGHSLYQNNSAAAQIFKKANDILGYDIAEICFNGPETSLTEARHCQPALFIHGYILSEILRERGLLNNLKACLGLSLGELTALAVAGVFDFETGLRIVAQRGNLMQEACEATEGAMTCLIGGSLKNVQDICSEFDVDMANLNCPGQIVISGEKSKIQAASEKAAQKDFKRVIPLNVAGAYHSRLMASASSGFSSFLENITFNKPQVTVFTNTTGAIIEEPNNIKSALAKQIVDPVRWEDCMNGAITLNIKSFYECGPGNVLTGLAKRIDKSIKVEPIGEWNNIPSMAITE